MKSDEDKLYNCTATNDVGSDSAVGELKVLGQCVRFHVVGYSFEQLRGVEVKKK